MNNQGSHKHSPLVQGNPGGCCPEIGITIFDDDGVEWEQCPCCEKIGRVYIVGTESLLIPNEIGQRFLKVLRQNLAIGGYKKL